MLKRRVRGRRLLATVALLSALVLVAASCGGGGGAGRPIVNPPDPIIPIVPADDHGDTRSDATDLALGSSLPGEIEEGDDDDFFRVQVTNAGTLTVFTTGDLNTQGELQASDGSFLASNDDGGDDKNFEIEHDLGPGTYHVRVRSIGTDTGSYVVRARFLTHDTWGATGAIPPQTMARLDIVSIFNLEQFFSYPRTMGLHFTATAADPDFVLILFPVAHGPNFSIHSRSALGSTTVTVTATDSNGRTASQTFTVTVENLFPRPGIGLYQFPQTVFLDSNYNAHGVWGERRFDLDTYFYDPDGDELSYEVASSNPGAVSAQVMGKNMLVLTGVQTARDAQITVAATDTYGASVAQYSLAIVRNARPEPIMRDWSRDPLVVTVEVCESVTLDLSGYFMDPDGDAIAYGYRPDSLQSYPEELTYRNRHVATANIGGTALTITGVSPGYTTHEVHAYNPHAFADERYYRDTSYGSHDSFTGVKVEIEVTGEEKECDSDEGGEPPDEGGEPPDGGGNAWYAGAFIPLSSDPMIVSVDRPTAEENRVAVVQMCENLNGEDEEYCLPVWFLEGSCVAQAVADERRGEGVWYAFPFSGGETPRAAEEGALQDCRSADETFYRHDAESCRIAVSGVCAIRP